MGYQSNLDKPIIITGDHRLTATAIAQEVGLSADIKNVVEGDELNEISDDELIKKINEKLNCIFPVKSEEIN